MLNDLSILDVYAVVHLSFRSSFWGSLGHTFNCLQDSAKKNGGHSAKV